MNHALEPILLALAIAVAAVIAAKRVGLPYNVVLVLVGLLATLAEVLPARPLDPFLVLHVFLPGLVFEAALSSDVHELRAAARPILALAIPGVAVSLLATGGLAMLALGLPPAIALLCGALLAITDTVSVIVAFRAVRVPHRLAAIMEGESLFNDGTALVLVVICTGAALGPGLGIASALRALFGAIVFGAALGAALSVLGSLALRRAPDHLTVILLSVVLVFAAALSAERVHASPVIAVVVAGLALGAAARRHLPAGHALALRSFWETAVFGINVFLFLLVGMQVDGQHLLSEAWTIGVAVLALHAGRAVAVYGGFRLLRLLGEAVPTRWQHVMVAGNIKGALSMAAVLALPLELPERERLVTIVFGVTVVTLLTQGLGFERLLRRLGVVEGARDPERELAKASLVSARRGLVELDALLDAGILARGEHAERRAELVRSVLAAERTLRAREVFDPRVEASLVSSRKAALLEARERGVITREAADELVLGLDRRLLELERGAEERSER